MPKPKPLTDRQSAFAKVYAETGSKTVAGRVATPTSKNPAAAANRALESPAVAAEVAKQRRKLLDLSDATELAVKVLVDTLRGPPDKVYSAALKVKAADVTLKHYKALAATDGERELSEMTPGELASRAAELRLATEAIGLALADATAPQLELMANEPDDEDDDEGGAPAAPVPTPGTSLFD